MNKNFKSKGATIPAPTLPTSAPRARPRTTPGRKVIKATDFFPAPVSFFNPPASTNSADDTAIKNDNTRISGIARART